MNRIKHRRSSKIKVVTHYENGENKDKLLKKPH